MAVTLNAQPRTERGKSGARALRRAGEVPAVIYGHGDETRPIKVNAHELEKLLATISVENTIIELTLDGATTPALIREVQHHPVRPLILHLDFYQVHAGEKIHLDVPVRIQGNPVGVRDLGGILQEVLHELSVECLPKDIPQAIDVDVAELSIGDSLHVRDIEVPNVRILNDPDLVIVTVTPPTTGVVEAEGEGEGAGEPEVVSRRPATPE